MSGSPSSTGHACIGDGEAPGEPRVLATAMREGGIRSPETCTRDGEHEEVFMNIDEGEARFGGACGSVHE